jgi:hypothetical protein
VQKSVEEGIGNGGLSQVMMPVGDG